MLRNIYYNEIYLRLMNDEELIDKLKHTVLEHTGNDLISLYVIGSFITKDMTENSDIDFVGLMKSSYDFDNEEKLNEILNDKISSAHIIDIGMMNYDAFFGGEPKGRIMEHIDLPVFINFLKKAKLIHGKQINFDEIPIMPASLKDELEYHIETFNELKDEFKEKDQISYDFFFRDFIKIIFYIANIELELIHDIKPASNYSEIATAYKFNENHIVHYSLKLRNQTMISNDEKIKWIDLAEQYLFDLT